MIGGRAPSFGAAVVLAALVVAGCSGTDQPPEVAAVVEDIEIPASETESLLQTYMNSEAGQKAKERSRKSLLRFVLLYQIKLTYLEHLAREAGVDLLAAPQGDLSRQLPAHVFQLAGVRPQDLSRSFAAGQLSRAMAEKLFPNTSVSDEDLRAEYDRRALLNEPSWRITAKVAGFPSDEVAGQLGERVKSGEPFGEVAAQLGAVETGTVDITPVSPLPPPVLEAVGRLRTGEVSAPLRVSDARWVAVFAERREALPRLSFDAVRGELTSFLADQQRQGLFQSWFDRKLRTARIHVSGHYGRWDEQQGTVV